MSKKSILIIGSGGREHALGWKLSQSKLVGKLYFAPGNGGTCDLGENVLIGIEDIDALLKFVKKNNIYLSVVGPEAPLEKGIVDEFEKQNLKIFGPTQAAARLETDKVWATEFMKRHKIPHPISISFVSGKKAKAFFQNQKAKDYVIKASGLAAGKGVVLPTSQEEAENAIEEIMVKKIFGDAGLELIIQERISGPEVSVLAFSDGKTVVPLLPAQDHKRALDGNTGPNTGGMGAYAPVPFVDNKLLDKITKTILQPAINGMRDEGMSYRGVLYAGLMLTKKGPMVLEYNVRFGDPETQPLMMLLESDLLPILEACIDGKLDKNLVRFKKGAAACVVLAAQGYPGSYQKGTVIKGLEKIDHPEITAFHGGTDVQNNNVVTNGGRVLGVSAYAQKLDDATNLAYSAVGEHGVYFDNMQYRSDIGKNAEEIQ